MDYIGIGVNASGQIDTKTGVVIGTAGHIDNYIDSPIQQALCDQFKLRVSVNNDANCMLLGEKWLDYEHSI